MKRFDHFIGAVAIIAFFMLLAELCGYLDQYAHFFKFANLTVIALFVLHVVASFLLSRNKREHFKRNWLDLIVFIPLVQLYHGTASRAAPPQSSFGRRSSSSWSSRDPARPTGSSRFSASGPRNS